MGFHGGFTRWATVLAVLALAALMPQAPAQSSASSSSSSSTSKPAKRSASSRNSPLDSGSVGNGVYRNPAFGFSCKIPEGWVLRTDDMNEGATREGQYGAGTVLLAAFSRPPEAHGEEINSSILIAAESAAAYPGLKDAAQYFGPVSEVAKARGFDVDEEPYEFAMGAKTLIRGDFEKDVGTRVMHQSTLVMLARDYAVSFTFIGGTDDEVDELVEGLNFGASKSK